MAVGERINTRLLCYQHTEHGPGYSVHRYRTQPFVAKRPPDGSPPRTIRMTCEACGERLSYHVLSEQRTTLWRRVWAVSVVGALALAGVAIFAFVQVVNADPPIEEPGAELALIPVAFLLGLFSAYMYWKLSRADPGVRGPGAPMSMFWSGHKLAAVFFGDADQSKDT